MGKYDSMFKKMSDQPDVGSDFAERVKLGEHVLRLLRYGIRDSDQEMGAIIEAEFEVVESTTYKDGELCGCAWWPQMGGWAGKYNTTRNKAFARAVAESEALGDQELPYHDLGGKMVEDDQPYRGILVHCHVTRGKEREDSPGEFYQNEKWTAITQTEEELVAAREELDGRKPLVVEKDVEKTKTVTASKTSAAKPEVKKYLLAGYGKK